MVGMFASCRASAVSGPAARDGGRLLSCGISAGLMPASGGVQASGAAQERLLSVRFPPFGQRSLSAHLGHSYAGNLERDYQAVGRR